MYSHANKKYGLIILKNDALRRKLTDDILAYLQLCGYKIAYSKDYNITCEQVIEMKRKEFLTNWTIIPTGEVLRLLLAYEAQSALLVFMENLTSDDDFVRLKAVKGNHHLPHKCNSDSIRYRFRDLEQEKHLFEYNSHIWMQRKLSGEIAFPENIIHTPDTLCENVEMLKIFRDA